MTITVTPYMQELLKQIAYGQSPKEVLQRALEAVAEQEITPDGDREAPPADTREFPRMGITGSRGNPCC